MVLEQLLLGDVAENASRVPDDEGARRHIFRDDRTCSHEGLLADLDPGAEDRAAADAGAAADRRSLDVAEPFLRSAHPVVVRGHDDNWMGRTEKRFGNIKGPTIRRGARVGGGAILCPGVEIGEEAFVGAGAVVTKDVPPHKLVVGNPARVLRDVPVDELLENQ